jgi:hypothetical protein
MSRQSISYKAKKMTTDPANNYRIDGWVEFGLIN